MLVMLVARGPVESRHLLMLIMPVARGLVATLLPADVRDASMLFGRWLEETRPSADAHDAHRPL